MDKVLIFFACYLAIALAANGVAIKYRRELAEKVMQAKRIEGLDQRQIATLDSFVLSMRSLRTAVIMCLVFGQLLLTPKDRLRVSSKMTAGDEALFEGGLMPRILELHLASAAAVNPVFGAIAYALRFAVHLRFSSVLGDASDRSELRSVTARYAVC